MIIPKEISDGLAYIKSNIQRFNNEVPDLGKGVREFERTLDGTQRDFARVRKQHLAVAAELPNTRRGVSERCARFMGAITIIGAAAFGRLDHIAEENRNRILRQCQAALDVKTEVRSTLTSADIPLPTVYARELVKLVETYGLARKYGIVMPVSAETKLPRLKTSPGFGFIDQSAAVDEKEPAIEFVTFPPEKMGGIIRIPSEIDDDSLVDLGGFIANYCAREAARFEDVVFFTADGTSTYKSFKGITKTAIDLGKKVVLSPTKTSPADIQLADLRALRGKVSSAALFSGAYYMHPTYETLLVKFNNPANVTTLAHSKGAPVRFADPVYVARGKSGGPELDGRPVRFVPVMPAYTEESTAGAAPVAFGDLSFEYLATNGEFSLKVSRDVFFSTDELAVRALERFAVGLMADDAIAALQLAS